MKVTIIRRLLIGLILALGIIGCATRQTMPVAVFRSGLVLDSAHHPVADATVEVYHQNRLNSSPAWNTTLEETLHTDAQGRFQFSDAFPFKIIVAQKAGFAPAWQMAHAAIRGEPPETIVLAQPQEITGKVVDDKDQPVADAEVWVSQAHLVTSGSHGQLGYGILEGKPARELFKCRTGVDGQFRLENVPPDCGVDFVVMKPGMGMREPPLEPGNLESTQCQSGQRDVKLVVDPAGQIAGKVFVQATGKPLAGVKVSLPKASATFNFDDGREAAISAADGTFHFADVAPGTYRISAWFGQDEGPTPLWASAEIQVSVTAGQKLIDVKIPAIKGDLLEVKVVDPKKKPITNVGVNAFGKGYGVDGTTDAKGKVQFRLPAGDYSLSIGKQHWVPMPVQASVTNGHTSYSQVTLMPLATLTGTVHTVSGAPAAGVRMMVYPQSGDEVLTDDEGKFQILWNPKELDQPGQRGCLVARDWVNGLATTGDISATTTNIDLTLEPTFTLSGKTIDENGAPITNARLTLSITFDHHNGFMTTSFDNSPCRTDSHGEFEFTTLPRPLSYNVDVRARGYGSARQNVEWAGTHTNHLQVELTLKTANLKLAGKVMDATGKPVAGAYMSLIGEGQPYVPAQTDQNGHFEYHNLCTGLVRIGTLYKGVSGSASARSAIQM